jgi:hypothetical protein
LGPEDFLEETPLSAFNFLTQLVFGLLAMISSNPW